MLQKSFEKGNSSKFTSSKGEWTRTKSKLWATGPKTQERTCQKSPAVWVKDIEQSEDYVCPSSQISRRDSERNLET